MKNCLNVDLGVASESPSLKMEPQQTQQQQQQQQQMSGSRMRGGGSFGHQMLDAATGRSSGGPVIADDSSSAFAGEMLAPPQRPSSLAVSSAYFHHAGMYRRTSTCKSHLFYNSVKWRQLYTKFFYSCSREKSYLKYFNKMWLLVKYSLLVVT